MSSWGTLASDKLRSPNLGIEKNCHWTVLGDDPGQRETFLSFDALSIYNCAVQCKEMSKKKHFAKICKNENVIDGFLGKLTLLATAQETVAREWIML